jgi:hypothetical protein
LFGFGSESARVAPRRSAVSLNSRSLNPCQHMSDQAPQSSTWPLGAGISRP